MAKQFSENFAANAVGTVVGGHQLAAPEYSWVYVLLLLSMIPSLINLMIGGLALTRGIPGLPYFLLRFMADGTAVPNFGRVSCVDGPRFARTFGA